MTDWPVKTLGEVCDLVNGATPDTKVKDYWGGKHAWITPAEMGGLDSPFLTISRRTLSDKGLASCSATLVPPKTVILSSRAPIGHLVINEVPMATNQGCKSLIPKDGLDFSFLYYYLKANVELLESLGTGTTFKELSGTQLKTVGIPVPPLEEQKRIVALLDAATARVTELTACYEQARTHANNLFTSALRDALAPLDSWPVKRLGDLCLFVRGPFGGSLKKSVFVSTGHAVYEQQHAIYGKFDKFRYFVSLNKFQEMKRFEVFPGDILMSCSGTIGKTVIVPVGAPAGIINQALLKLSCSEKLNNQYLCVWMRSLYFQEAVFASVVGVALQNVASVTILKNIPISLPPLEQQKQIVTRLDSMRAKTSEMAAAYDAKLTAAKNLQQSILEAAFAGEL